MSAQEGGIARTMSERIAQGFSAVMAFGPLVYLAWVGSELPTPVPSHFGFNGQADAWSDGRYIWVLPSLSVALFVGLSLLERVPHVYNYPLKITDANREHVYRLGRQLALGVKTLIVSVFAYITVATVQTAAGRASGLGAWFVPTVLVASALGITLSVVRLRRLGRAN